MKRDEEVEVVLPTFEIKEEVEKMIPTFVIKLKTGWRGWSSVKKGRIEWHTNASARKQRKILKLHLLSLGSPIVTPKKVISF